MAIPNPPHEEYPTPPCHTCNFQPSNERRNLVVLNVQSIYNTVKTNYSRHLPKQLRYMSPTRTTHHMRSDVEGAYSWLVRHYRPGDQIYLFGFGQGAYAVRALAGMIYEVGLIRDPSPKKASISGAYHLYELNRSRPSTRNREDASRFKHDNCWQDLRVHFVGVWDTLSPIERKAGRVSPISSAAHACHFRHALALDETNPHLFPEYLQGSAHSSIKCSNDIETCKIKEVWFEGDHVDLGGGLGAKWYPIMRRDYYHPRLRGGNVPLLWMHREASENGLRLENLDLDFLPSERYYLPLRMLLSDKPRLLQHRRALPGQKVHITVLLEARYERRNFLTGGVPGLKCPGIDVYDELWEHELFDDAIARRLISDSLENLIPYPRKMLCVLRFEQGRACIHQVPDIRETWRNAIQRRLELPGKLGIEEFALCFAYWVAFYNGGTETGCSDRADRDWILSALNLALDKVDSVDEFFFPPIIRDELLRKELLAPERIKTLIRRLDKRIEISRNWRYDFGRWTEVIADLVECGHHRELVVEELNKRSPSRLTRMLSLGNDRDVIAALRIVQTLSQTVQGAKTCVTPGREIRLHELALRQGYIGALAANALASLAQNAQGQFDVKLHSREIRAGILACNDWCTGNEDVYFADSGINHQILDRLSATIGEPTSPTQDEQLYVLLSGVKLRNKEGRTTATLILLKLCENATMRKRLLDMGFLDIFIEKMSSRNASLLAAYALLVCLKHDDLKGVIHKDARVPKYIVRMLSMDCFNDWLGQVEGYQILGGFMRNVELWRDPVKLDMLVVLEEKLYTHQRKSMWRKLAFPQSNLLRSFENNGLWTKELVGRSLEQLKREEWAAQRAGIAVFAALARTDFGVDAIKDSVHIHDIIKMLLDASRGRVRLRTILGPACALRILSENETYRKCVHDLPQYDEWKKEHLPNIMSKDGYQKRRLRLFNIAYTFKPREYRDGAPWQVNTPTLCDVQLMLSEAARIMDEEFSEGELPPVETTIPPKVMHWSRLRANVAIGSAQVVIVTSSFVVTSVIRGVSGAVSIASSTLSNTRIFLAALPITIRIVTSEQVRNRHQDEEE